MNWLEWLTIMMLAGFVAGVAVLTYWAYRAPR